MPTNIEVGEGDVEKIEAGNAGNKEYKRQCQRILVHFISYKNETEKDDRDLIGGKRFLKMSRDLAVEESSTSRSCITILGKGSWTWHITYLRSTW